MKCNVGGIDKIIRIIVGVVILVLGFVYASWWGLIGLIPLFTGLTGRCMLYVPFGISTCKTESENK